MPKHGPSRTALGMSHAFSSSDQRARTAHRRARRLMRRGDERKALQLLRENASREATGASYCWLAAGLLEADKQAEALQALRQALYTFRYDHLRGRARTVARWILSLDPSDGAARKIEARGHTRAAA